MNTPEQNLAEDWHVPVCENKKTLREALIGMDDWKLNPEDVPLIIKLVENPEYGHGLLFPGPVSLLNHDCIHAILGRGAMPKDEAFVIGYTMGTTKRMTKFKSKLFLLTTRYLYPEGYGFGEEEAWVFNMGVICGEKSLHDFSKVEFKWWGDWTLQEIRRKLNIDVDFLKLCYILEKKRFPKAKESQRLICTI